jgi:Flp pilus assembly protein TadD
MEHVMSTNTTLAETVGLTFEHAQVIAKRACDLAESGDLAGAAAALEGLTAVNPLDTYAKVALGWVYQELGRSSDAEEQFNDVLELIPEHPLALGGRGELRLKRGDQGGAADLRVLVNFDRTDLFPKTRRARTVLAQLAIHGSAP